MDDAGTKRELTLTSIFLGVLLSAGLIAGEGVCGIALAVVTVMFK